jgi:hypothetical protein
VENRDTYHLNNGRLSDKGIQFGSGGKEIKCQTLKHATWVRKARKVALYMAQRYPGLGNWGIEERFGGIEGSGVSKAASWAKEEIVSDKRLSKLARELDSSFKA